MPASHHIVATRGGVKIAESCCSQATSLKASALCEKDTTLDGEGAEGRKRESQEAGKMGGKRRRYHRGEKIAKLIIELKLAIS